MDDGGQERVGFADVFGHVGLDECMGFVAPYFNVRYPFRAFGRHGTLPKSSHGDQVLNIICMVSGPIFQVMLHSYRNEPYARSTGE